MYLWGVRASPVISKGHRGCLDVRWPAFRALLLKAVTCTKQRLEIFVPINVAWRRGGSREAGPELAPVQRSSPILSIRIINTLTRNSNLQAPLSSKLLYFGKQYT